MDKRWTHGVGYTLIALGLFMFMVGPAGWAMGLVCMGSGIAMFYIRTS